MAWKPFVTHFSPEVPQWSCFRFRFRRRFSFRFNNCVLTCRFYVCDAVTVHSNDDITRIGLRGATAWCPASSSRPCWLCRESMTLQLLCHHDVNLIFTVLFVTVTIIKLCAFNQCHDKSYAPAWWNCAWTTEDRFTATCPWVIRAFVLHGAISIFEIAGYLLNRTSSSLLALWLLRLW